MALFKTKDGVELYCEYGFESTPELLRNKEVNGCGPDGWKSVIVPDTIYGLCITDACNIHDWMYLFGNTIDDKDRADRVLLNNIIRIIEAKTTKNWFGRNILKPLRYRRAKIYYDAVHYLGGSFYWANKRTQTKS